MSLTWIGVLFDSHHPDRLAEFWLEALGYEVVFRDDNMVAIAPAGGTYPGLGFVRVPDDKRGKNRLHLDLRPDDQLIEVARLLELGATRVDIGQGDPSWIVMTDPEGNEFCVLG